MPSSSPSSATPSSDGHALPTPHSYLSPIPDPAIASPDEFTFQIDLHLDRIVRRSSTANDDMSKAQVLLRNKGRWQDVYNSPENSPPPPLLQHTAGDDFAWEAAHSPLLNLDQLPDPSRCSLLIHEVGLLVGLTEGDDHIVPDDDHPLVPHPPIQVHDILPLTLTPTKYSNHTDAGANVSRHSSNPPTPQYIPRDAIPNPHSQRLLPRVPAKPVPRQKNTTAACPSLSSRRRHGQVFDFEPPLRNALRPSALDLDETFCHPRQPPPKPSLTPPANYCSSLDRLESSLRKLEAHAPHNHRKSQSRGPLSDRVSYNKVLRPSLPPPRRLKQQQSSCEIMHHDLPRSAPGRHFSGPLHVPGPIVPPQYVASQTCPPVPLDDDHFEEEHTPGSFMDMDIPHSEEPRQKRPASFRQDKGNEKMKSLVGVAKRVSRGIVAWGKILAVPVKPSVTARGTTVQSARA